ncbi:COB(I) alamin adenosyltransferase [Salmonella enterica subsp. arizonae]|uniref:COB(I) alamin adenosyltransferase n=1 Tax=Salmonella enterica subsp. arizonae TaxID=59203 RepID=A0A379S6K0_SALER|nr:COB(I) alamin adenosyltransferase [Salmonella enterica subsp. arizonae]
MSNERYQQRQQKVKDRVDARVAQAQEERVLLSCLPAMVRVKPRRLSGLPPAPWGMVKTWACGAIY